MCAPLPVLLAALPEYPTVAQTLTFQMNGLMVVFLTLGSIWFLLSILGLAFRFFGASTAAKPVAAAAPPPAPPAVSATGLSPAGAGPPPELVAAIAAAVYATIGSNYRITAITTARIDPDWAREGRRQIFASHRVR